MATSLSPYRSDQSLNLPVPPIFTEFEEHLPVHETLPTVLFGDQSSPRFAFLNNDFPSPIEFGGKNYLCATAAYEAQKFQGRPEIMDLFTQLCARQAFTLSAEKHQEKDGDWQPRRQDRMYHVLKAKFGESSDLQQKLLATGNAYLSDHTEHKNMDPFWTDDSDGSGQNLMGRYLMKIRKDFGGTGPMKQPENYKAHLPSKLQTALPPSLDKPKDAILKEIENLNLNMDEEEYARETKEARDPSNLPFTRFKTNNFPYDRTRVPLTSGHFINANFLLNKQFIGTQSPMPHTFEDFWTMVWEQEVPIIIMLNRLGDPGDDIYFPFAMEDTRHYGQITLELTDPPAFTTDPSWRHAPYEEELHAVVHREIKLTFQEKESRRLHHFQYVNWHDFSAGNERAVTHLIKRVDALRREREEGPVLIHCHAGVGRTSVMITLLHEYRNLTEQKEVDIEQCLTRQRSPMDGRCHSMMQAPGQYAFCYNVLQNLST